MAIAAAMLVVMNGAGREPMGVAEISQANSDTLERGFINPPAAARPGVFWQWSGGMISREGLTKDLEAMAAQGIGGVMVMQLPEQFAHKQRWDFRDYPGKVKVLSDEWFALVNHAIGEADRLGMTFSIFICPGWSHAGGPWITPERSLKVLVSGKLEVQGPLKLKKQIPRGPKSIGWHHEAPSWLGSTDPSETLQQASDFYRDVAVMAVPVTEGAAPVQSDKIIELTGRMDTAGVLAWDVPAGNWTILRYGVASENGINHPAPFEATGRESDRMDPEAVRMVFDGMIGRIIREAKAKGYRSFKAFETDSYEAGFQDFGLDFREQFLQRRGYDCAPWLSTWADKNQVIESRNLTERFRSDMMRTISELMDERFYRKLRSLADENDVEWMIEPYFKLHIDWRTTGARSEMPGAEFWIGKPFDYVGPGPDIAALYGLPVVWAEAFTAESYNSAWRNDPWEMKPWGDVAYCRGLNQFYMHGFVHNPFGDNLQPGFTMSSWGTQLGRHVTWWPYADSWHRYLARCQFMLQQGRPVNDLLAYPQKRQHVATPALDAGDYRQVVLNDEALMERIAVRSDGRLTVKGGGDFAAIALTPGLPLSPEALRKIRDLVKAGAVLIGERPVATSSSLENYPACDSEIAALIEELWGKPGTTADGERAFGKGRVLTTSDIPRAMDALTGGSDLRFRGASQQVLASMDFVHRRNGSADIYFVCNTGDEAANVDIDFRVSGLIPGLWDPVTGEIKQIGNVGHQNGRTKLTIHFAPRQSFFVVFRKEQKAEYAVQPFMLHTPPFKTIKELGGSWAVHFDPRWGGTGQVEFAKLEDWSRNEEKGIRYYSGTAVYRKTFDLPRRALTKDGLYISLGEVYDLARVSVNGHDLGVVWCAPWKVKIPRDILEKKGNELKIEVVNTWVNRLIGDEQEPEDCELVEWNPDTNRKGSYDLHVASRALKDLPGWVINGTPRPSKGRYTFTTWRFYDKAAPVQPAGLIGPVKIVAVSGGKK